MNRKLKDTVAIDDELIDEITDEILDSMKKDKPSRVDGVQRNLDETKLKARIAALENRVEKYIRSFKIDAVEAEREISERSTSLENENAQQITHLQIQLENLRTAMIRLANEVKRIKETSSS